MLFNTDDSGPAMWPSEVADVSDSALEDEAFNGFDRSAINVGLLFTDPKNFVYRNLVP